VSESQNNSRSFFVACGDTVFVYCCGLCLHIWGLTILTFAYLDDSENNDVGWQSSNCGI
jgi:hypothetical protein